jgi:Reverse transcriptase (RNA-dependent DNA polymerase)
MMDDIFRPEIMEGWLCIYMDDFVIATKNEPQDHDTKVRHVLQKLQDHNLYLKPKKCSFSQQEVEYLGVIIGGGKVRMDPVKVKGITNWPTPTTVWDVCSFLEFCNFYRAFIPHFSDVARPLNDLTCKNHQWSWSN